jgi:heptosyltransferase I
MAKRILIVRLSAIGDSILSVPVLNSLRRRFPQAEIAWVTERASAQLLEGHRALDRLFVTSKQTFRLPRAFWQLARQLRDWRPDVTIDLQGLTKSSLLAWSSGAKERYGFRRETFDGRELSTWLNNRTMQPKSVHMIDRGLELASSLGADPDLVEFELPETDDESCFADRTRSELTLGDRFAIINVGAGWPSKLWPSERYAAVAQHLWNQWGVPSLVVWSGDAELLAAKKVVAMSDSHAVLAPMTSLVQLRGLIRRACLFVGSDTGPMHLSVALGTPTVGMIGPMPKERVAPYGPQNIAVQNERLDPTRMFERKTNTGPMLSISMESVNAAVDRLMHRIVMGQIGNRVA